MEEELVVGSTVTNEGTVWVDVVVWEIVDVSLLLAFAGDTSVTDELVARPAVTVWVTGM